jgi:acetolactate synthase I/II/III large subunit
MSQIQSRSRGADALVRAMQQGGVRRIFTLSGNHIMPVFDALFDSGIALTHVRHEGAAVHMADAWARITGEVGIALVTGGPGHANAIGALYTAAMAESPIVLLSGHAPTRELGCGSFQEMAQADIAAPLTKASWTCASVDALASDFAKAVRIAHAGRPGPVHLSLPVDLLEAQVNANVVPASSDLRGAPTQLTDDQIAKVLARLRVARRPLILTGPVSMTRRGRQATSALEAALGIAVVGMESPRGVADPSLGAFAATLAQADCVLLLGKRLDFTLKFGAVPTFARNCEFIQIDGDAGERERATKALTGRLCDSFDADALATAKQLTQVAASSDASADASLRNNTLAAAQLGWRADVHAAIAYRPTAWASAQASVPDKLHPVQALRPLQALLNSHPDSVFISDGGEIGQWAQACLSAPHRLINGVAGSIGASLPYALAARCAIGAEAPVVAVMGDGTFGFHPAEFDTAHRYQLPFIALVGNDARWNAEYQIQLRDYGANRLIGCELQASRYDQVCIAFGGHGEWVTQAEQMPTAIARAVESGKAACLNVMIEGLAAPQIKR